MRQIQICCNRISCTTTGFASFGRRRGRESRRMECSLVPYKLYVCAENGMRKCTKVRFWRLHFLAVSAAISMQSTLKFPSEYAKRLDSSLIGSSCSEVGHPII